MAKEATNTKPSVQIDIYCQAVHKNVYTLEYAGAKKQIIDFVIFLSYSFFFLIYTKLLTSIAYQLKQCLWNPSQSVIWWLITTRRNFYLPVHVQIYCDCAMASLL